MKRALITGITGQDGSYLAELLVGKGYVVTGIVLGNAHTDNLAAIARKVELVEGDVLDETFLREQVSKQFDEIYNLASVSTVHSPWEDPAGTVRSCGLVPLVILEAIHTSSPHTRFFQASSAEMYGDPIESPQTEHTPFQPRSPYGWGKLLAHQAVEGYRTTHNLFAVSGILFNHESPRRGEHFVTRKITSTLARIARGSGEGLQLGNLDSKRDWSFAGDIVRGMWMSLQTEKPGSYVFASGEVHTVREFVEAVANILSIKIFWEGKGVEEKGFDEKGKIIVAIKPDFYRSVETTVRRGDISCTERELGWSPSMSFKTLVELMVKADSVK
jgi:GDPmannose 4,6-dehydratase